MSTQREKLIESMRKSGDGHAIKLNESEFTAPKQAAGLTLGDVEQTPLDEIKIDPDHKGQFEQLSGDEFERLKADIAERGILVPLIVKKDGTLLAGHNRREAASQLGLKSVPVQRLSNPLSKDQERAFVIKDNLLRRQLKPEQQTKMLAELYPDYLDTVSSSEGGSLGGRKKQIGKETGFSGKALQRHKKTHLLAKTTAKSEGKAKPELEHYRKAVQTLNNERRAKQPKNTPSDRTGKAQASSAKPGKGSGRDENLTGFPAVSAALVAIRREMPKLSRADKKRVKKELERLVAEADL